MTIMIIMVRMMTFMIVLAITDTVLTCRKRQAAKTYDCLASWQVVGKSLRGHARCSHKDPARCGSEST